MVVSHQFNNRNMKRRLPQTGMQLLSGPLPQMAFRIAKAQADMRRKELTRVCGWPSELSRPKWTCDETIDSVDSKNQISHAVAKAQLRSDKAGDSTGMHDVLQMCFVNNLRIMHIP